jgi:hypothetical protein
MMEYIQAFPASLTYISSAPYFWLSMGMSAGFAMFIGAIIYDGELEYVWKGLLSVGMYGFFLAQITFTRVNYNYTIILQGLTPGQAWANITTIVVLSCFWVIGVMIGVFISSFFHKNHRRHGV